VQAPLPLLLNPIGRFRTPAHTTLGEPLADASATLDGVARQSPQAPSAVPDLRSPAWPDRARCGRHDPSTVAANPSLCRCRLEPRPVRLVCLLVGRQADRGCSRGRLVGGPSMARRSGGNRTPAQTVNRPHNAGACAQSLLQATANEGFGRSSRLFGLREVAPHGPGGHQEDLHVEPERPVLDVVVVPFDAVAQRGLAAEAVHLRPAGDA
jgi:hypothetical protein